MGQRIALSLRLVYQSILMFLRYQMRKASYYFSGAGHFKAHLTAEGTIINSFDPYSLSEQINFQFNLSYSNVAEV